MMTAVILVTAFLASLLTLFSGFGLGTLIMLVVAIFFPVTVAVALTAFVHLLNNLFKLAVLWRTVNWPVSFKFGLPALLATIPGAWLLISLSALPPMISYQVFVGVLVGKTSVRKVTIARIQKLVTVMLRSLGTLLVAGIL